MGASRLPRVGRHFFGMTTEHGDSYLKSLLWRSRGMGESKMSEHLQVVTTVDTEEKAKEITRVLVERRLAACAQVFGPITSTYWWHSQVETAQEWLCILKTRKGLYEELERTLRSIHPYEVPEILAIPVAAGNPAYLAWLDETLKR